MSWNLPWSTKTKTFYYDNQTITSPSIDIDWKTVDDVAIIINKLAKTFSSGEMAIVNEQGEKVSDTVYPVILKPNSLTDWRTMAYRYYWLKSIYGVGYLYFKDQSFWLLENSGFNPIYKPKSIFNGISYMDFLMSATYTSNSTQVDLLADGGMIVPIYDIGFDHGTLKPISKLEQILDTAELSGKTIKAMQYSMDRTSLAMLSPEKDMPHTLSDKTDDKLRAERKSWFNDFSLKNGALTILNRKFSVLDTNPDNKKLLGVEFANHSLGRFCMQYGINQKLVVGDSKYDDLNTHKIELYTETIIPDASKYMSTINEYTNKKSNAIYYGGRLEKLEGYNQQPETEETTED